MKKYILLTAVLCFCLALPLYAQDGGDLRKATIDVADKVGRSVVSISTVVKEKIGKLYFGSPFEGFGEDNFRRFFEEFFGESQEREFERRGLGSGVIIDKQGYILTNEHVISGASEVKVQLSDGRDFIAEVKGTDKRSDLAVIKIEANGLPVAKLGDSESLVIGEWVVAIGNPFGPYIDNPEPTVTVGVVSALHRFLPPMGARARGLDDLIQTDAAINPGNSGGPLVNLSGEVVGINTAIITTSGGYQGLGFATPINKAKKVLTKLLKGEKILYGWLGVNIQDLNDDLRNYFGIQEREGVIVLKVYKDSPAEEGGLKEGDLILAFNNQSVGSTKDLVRMVASIEVGETVPIKILRSGKEKALKIKIASMPAELEGMEEAGESEEKTGVGFRGMSVEDITPLYKQKFRIDEEKGVVITDIEEGSLADRSEFRVGDVITKVEDTPIENKEDFKSATAKVKRGCLIKTNRGFRVLKSK